MSDARRVDARGALLDGRLAVALDAPAGSVAVLAAVFGREWTGGSKGLLCGHCAGDGPGSQHLPAQRSGQRAPEPKPVYRQQRTDGHRARTVTTWERGVQVARQGDRPFVLDTEIGPPFFTLQIIR